MPTRFPVSRRCFIQTSAAVATTATMSDDSYASAGKAIAQGVIGQVVQAQIEYVRRYGTQGPWRNPSLEDDMPKPAEHKKTGAENTDLHHGNLHNHLRKGEELNCPAHLGLAGFSDYSASRWGENALSLSYP